jgi:hypothetical protein
MLRTIRPHIIILVLVLLMSAGPVLGDQAPREPQIGPVKPSPNPMNVATDILILRPVGLVMIPVSAVIYGLGWPFAKASGSEKEAFDALVGQTVEFTFRRPLGQGAPFE